MQHAAVLLAALAVAATGAELKPFDMIWRADSGFLVDLSFLLEAPAGRDGFVNVSDGHLAKGNGQRLRIWGVNFSFTASLPAKELAPYVAAHLARFGINCVRVHHLDWRTPRGIIDSRHPDSRHLDPDALDRLDYLIAELKKRGIYTNLNLNVARAFQPEDGVKDAEQLGFAKAVTLFDPRMIELQKEYARQLLTHRNAYTGNEYRHEPAVAMVEIVNENSIIENWVRGRLAGEGPGQNQDRTWTDITASYERDLTARYHEWLAARGSAPVARLHPKEFKAASADRFRTEASFYMELEDRFFQQMYAFLKKDLGVRMPVAGTSVHSGGLSPYPLLSSTAKLDIVDAHTYWQHPSYITDRATGRRTGFTIPNTPAVNQPARSPIAVLSRAAVAGKPFMVSEVNHPYPSEYAAEGVPLLAAYGAFQDWDAIFWYSFEHGAAETWSTAKLPGNFDMRQDPVKMTQWAAGALMFLRGDVKSARRTVLRSYCRDEIPMSLLLPSSEQPYFSPGFPPELPLLHGSRIASLDGKPFEPFSLDARHPLVSDTGQLRWALSRDQKGSVRVDSPRSQALIGHAGWEPAANLSARIASPFAALMLVSLDEKPIGDSDRMLLTSGGRVANSGMVWNDKRTTVTDTGKPGMLIEPVEGTVALRSLAGATAVEVVPLDGAGRAAGPPISASEVDGAWEFRIGRTVTPWYLIRVTR